MSEAAALPTPGAGLSVSAGTEGRLMVAVPSKGRMASPALDLLEAAGLRFELGERALHIPCENAPVELLLVRPHDIPEYVQDGVVHVGITGANLVAEARADVVRLADLGFARCTLEAAVPTAAPQLELAGPGGAARLATSFPCRRGRRSPSTASRPSWSRSPARSRRRRGSVSRTPWSTSSPPGRRPA